MATLFALVAMLAFTSALPNQVLALGTFDQKPQPVQPSVLKAEKIDTAKTQATGEASTNSVEPEKKVDRTKVRELEEKRTANSSVYVNKDGTKTYEYSIRQKNYRNGNKWEKIDNKLSPVVGEMPEPNLWQTITNTAPDLKLPEEFTGKAGVMDVRMMSLSKGVSMSVDGKNITMKPVGSTHVRPEKKDDRTIVYKNAWKGVDLEYQTEGELVKENIVIKQKDVANEYEFKVTGAKLIDDPKRPGMFTVEGAKDGYGFGGLTLALNDRGPITIPDQSIKQERTGNNSIKVSLDKTWLASLPDSSFPIVIDPSFGRADADPTDWMFKSDGYSCQGNTCWIQAGTLQDNGWKHWRSYIHIPYPELAGGKKIFDANIHAVYNPNANPDPNQRYLLFGHANCIGWECRGKHLSTVLTAGDFDVNVTNELQLAVNAGDMGLVWSFWGEEVGYKTYKTYSNMVLSVLYDNPTSQATPIEPANDQVTTNTQPTLRVNPATDPDGDAIEYRYRVSTNPDGSGATINSGFIKETQWTVPDGILQDGTTYYWRVDTRGGAETIANWRHAIKIDLRTGKDSTQAYDTVGPIGIDLATGNATTSTSTHSMSALGGSIGLNLDYNTPTKSKTGLIGEYWNVNSNNINPVGDPQLRRVDQDINFTWLNGSSPGPGINADWFTARWTGNFVAPTTGAYQFGASQDDALSIMVNGQNFWGCPGSAPCYNGGSINLQAGQIVPIVVQFTEATGDGYVRVYVKGAVPEQTIPRDWLQTNVEPSISQYGLNGRYYTDDGSHNFPSPQDQQSRLIMARNDSKLSFQWGDGGPATGLQTDSFMARWTGYVKVPTTGTYTFGKNSDDGVRIKLNNGFMGAQNTVFDAWNYTPGTMWGSSVNLTAGVAVPITIEYFEANGPAHFALLMKGPGLNGAGDDIPVKWLTPKAEALPDAWRLGVDVDGNIGYERLRIVGQNIILEDSTRATHEYTWTGSGYKPPVNEDGQLTRNSNNTYTLLDTDGRIYIFDAEGKLTSLTTPSDDRNPASLKYEYAGDPSRLVKISDGVTDSRWGKPIYKGVNDNGSDACPTSPQQNVWPFSGGFDSAAPDGMLCAFKTSDGDITKFFYVNGQLSRIEKPGGETTDYEYDNVGRIISTRDSLAADVVAANQRTDNESVRTQITYDQLGRAKSVKAPAATAGGSRVEHTMTYIAGNTLPVYRHWLHPDSRTSSQVNIPGYSQQERQGYALTTQEAGTIPIFSCKVNWDEFVSADPNCEGFTKYGMIGYVYTSPPPDKPSTVLQRCVYLPSGDHFTWKNTGCDTRYSEWTLGYLLTDPGYAGITEMHVTGATEPHGFSKRVQYDSLLRTTKETDVTNLSNLTEWDGVKDLELSKTDATGLKSTTIYDDDDRPVENYGPAPAAWYDTVAPNKNKPLATYATQVPKTSTGYDEGIVGPDVSYYNYKADNKTLVGAPKLRSNGFADNTGVTTTPGVLEKVWGTTKPITPDAGMNGWGLRATGKIRVSTTGTYSFHLWHDDGLRVYLDDTLLADDWNDGENRRTDASRTLEAGKVYRLMIEYYDKGGYNALGLYMSGPNAQPADADKDWSAELKPGYSLKTSQTAYDSQLGNVSTTTTYSRPDYGTVGKTTLDPTGLNLQTTATYEAPGAGFLRQTSKTLPGGGTTSYQHYSATDTKDNPCTTDVESVNQGGKPKGKIEADPDGAGLQTPRTSETIYNASGETVATRYNNDDWTCTEYDNRGRVVRTILPTSSGRQGRVITNSYSVDNNPLIMTVTDASGTIRVENDLLGRVIKYTDSRGKLTTNIYDDFGKITSRISPLGTEGYEYDNYDRMIKQKLDGITFATIVYDQFSRIANVQYPAGISLSSIGRDVLGRENSDTFTLASSQTLIDQITRATSGDVVSGTENGVSKSYVYDQSGRLTSATLGSNTYLYEFGTSDASCSAIPGNNPNAGKNGNRTKLIANGQVTTYCYDMADRLIASSDPRLNNTQYDDHGNTTRLGMDGQKTEFGYDAGDRNTFIKQTTGGQEKQLLYERDAQSRITRREAKTNNVTMSDTYYSFTGSGDTPDALLDANGGVVQKYITLPGDVIATIKPGSTSAGATTYSLPNIHGDVFATVNADGSLISTFVNGPFGEQITGQTDPVNTATDATWSYVGQNQKLTESAISLEPTQMGARVYIGQLGRFLSVDPIEGGTDNNYVYANDPVNEFDLGGNALETIADIAGAAYDIDQMRRNPSWGNAAMLTWSLVAIVAPCVPGSYAGRIGAAAFKTAKGAAPAMTKKAVQAGKAVGSAAKVVRGKVMAAVAKVKTWAKPPIRIGDGRFSAGQAPMHYRKLGPIGKLINPLSLHVERGKAILTLNWFGKKVGGKYIYKQKCLWGKC